MRSLMSCGVLFLSSCAPAMDASKPVSAEPTSSASIGAADGSSRSRAPALLTYDKEASPPDGPPSVGPLARVEGVLEAGGGCVRLGMDTGSAPLVFEAGSVTSDGSTGIRLADGAVIAFGTRVELAGAGIADGQGTYPMARVETACGARRAILVTKGTLRRLPM